MHAFLAAIAFRDKLVVGVECIFCWNWLADMCEGELKLIDHYDPIIKDLDAQILRLANGHDPANLHLLKSINGVGNFSCQE